MRATTTPTGCSRAARVLALLLGLAFVLVPGHVARAETPTRDVSTNINMRCVGTTSIGEEIELYVVRRNDGPAEAELFLTSADGETQQMWTSTDAVIAEGLVTANIPLDDEGDAVVIVGTYRAAADAVTLHQRVRIDNSVVIGTLVYQPFEVQLTTADLGSIGPADLYCDVESISSSSRWSNPHRVVVRAEQPTFALEEECAVGVVQSVQLLPAEAEYVLIVRTAEEFGYGYVTPNGGTAELAWYDEQDELISVESLRVSTRRSGPPIISTTADGTTTRVVRATPQDVRLTFGLPNSDLYDVTCGGHSITQNFSTADTGR